jgi:hypothetical protein
MPLNRLPSAVSPLEFKGNRIRRFPLIFGKALTASVKLSLGVSPDYLKYTCSCWPADFDKDGDVDLADYRSLQILMTGL